MPYQQCKSGDHDQVGFSSQMDLLPCNAVFFNLARVSLINQDLL